MTRSCGRATTTAATTGAVQAAWRLMRSGLDPGSGRHVDVLTYSDAAALRSRLARGDVAAVSLEPALTNCGLVLPVPEFVAAFNAEVRAAGALLIVDETHTQFAVYGGGTRHFGFEPDIVTGGKGIGGAIPIGVVGMTDALAGVMTENLAYSPGREETGDCHGIATGGTMYANAMSLSAARAGLAEVFTRAAAGWGADQTSIQVREVFTRLTEAGTG